MEELQNKVIQCVCGTEFVFTAGEQTFYADKGYNEPKRCSSCRAKKKVKYGDQ